ncbi:hypothetical protein [Bacteriophage Eos]|nr:hypothetical protein [Bacteriophage Eos]
MSSLHPKLQEVLDWINEECAFEDDEYTVWVRYGPAPSTGCTVFSERYRITIELRLVEDKVIATPSMTTLGFSGNITGMALTMPNSHLRVCIEQLATIRLSLPEDNINDHFIEVMINERRLKRKRQRAKREVEKTRMACNMNPDH